MARFFLSQGAVLQVQAGDVAKVTSALSNHKVSVVALGAPVFKGDADIRIATKSGAEVRY